MNRSPDARRLPARALRVLAVGVAIVALLAVRVVAASAAALHEGERLEASGDDVAALAHLRRAARWYAPGNPYCTAALDHLEALAARAEAGGDADLALAAHRSIRGAILGARSTYTPHAERLSRADARIAALVAADEAPPMEADRSVDERRDAHLALLRAPRRPSVVWALVALTGLAGWVSAAIAFATRAVDDEDRIVAPAARLWGSVGIVAFGLFMLGLALA